MSKRELISGAIITLVVIILLNFYLLDVLELYNLYPAPINLSEKSFDIIAWIVTIDTLSCLVLAVIGVWKSNKKFLTVTEKFTIKTTIPGYFLVALFPLFMGFVLAGITGKLNWGVLLMCLSVPSLVVLFGLALKAYPTSVDQDGGKHGS